MTTLPTQPPATDSERMSHTLHAALGAIPTAGGWGAAMGLGALAITRKPVSAAIVGGITLVLVVGMRAFTAYTGKDGWDSSQDRLRPQTDTRPVMPQPSNPAPDPARRQPMSESCPPGYHMETRRGIPTCVPGDNAPSQRQIEEAARVARETEAQRAAQQAARAAAESAARQQAAQQGGGIVYVEDQQPTPRQSVRLELVR